MERRNALKILNIEPAAYSREAYRLLSQVGKVDEEELSREQLLERIGKYDVLIVRLRHRIDKEILSKAKNLKFILSATTGTDHIDTTFASSRNIQLVCLKGETRFLNSIPSTAEFTWGLLLALLRNIPAAVEHAKAANWQRDRYKGHNLRGQRLGILGLGRVGKQVATFAKAFGMSVSAYDPYQKNWVRGVKRYQTASSLFRHNRIICIHIPYDSSTEGFVNEELLAHLQAGSFLVNTSRAGIWDEKAIVQALVDGRIKAIATDVLTNEQDPGELRKNPLLKYALKHRNVIITPHIGGATFESMERTEIFVASKFLRKIPINPNTPNTYENRRFISRNKER